MKVTHPNTLAKRISQMLIELRKQRNLSQQSLAKTVRTTQAVISRIENMNANPSLELLERIAKACGKKLEIFFS
jgi:transcriptional regulator with XRE-family HTH domain